MQIFCQFNPTIASGIYSGRSFIGILFHGHKMEIMVTSKLGHVSMLNAPPQYILVTAALLNVIVSQLLWMKESLNQ